MIFTVTLLAFQGTLVSFPEDGAQLGSGGMGTVSAVTVSFAAAAKVPHDDKAREDLCNEAAAYTAIGPCDNIARPIAWVYAPELDKDVLLVELAAGSLHGLIRWAFPRQPLPPWSMFLMSSNP